MEMGGQRHAVTTLPPSKTPYPLYRRLGSPQGRSERVRKTRKTGTWINRNNTNNMERKIIVPVKCLKGGNKTVYISLSLWSVSRGGDKTVYISLSLWSVSRGETKRCTFLCPCEVSQGGGTKQCTFLCPCEVSQGGKQNGVHF